MAALRRLCGGERVIPASYVSRLLAAALLLPTVVIVLLGFGRLLNVLGDLSGGAFLHRAALVGGIAWVLSLIGLLLALAARRAGETSEEAEERQ